MRTLFISVGVCWIAGCLAIAFLGLYGRHSTTLGGILFLIVLAAFAVSRVLRKSVMIPVLFSGAFVFLGPAVWMWSAPSHTQLEELAEPTIRALEQYHDQSSRYPATLDVVSELPPKTRYGDWRYEVGDGGESFTLKIGDYDKDLFVGVYSSLEGKWWWDT